MFPAKIYVGQIAVVFGIVVTSTWSATQWAAHALGYQDSLGSSWFALSVYPVYLPWRLFEWWFAYEAYAPKVFERCGGPGRASFRMSIVCRLPSVCTPAFVCSMCAPRDQRKSSDRHCGQAELNA